MNKNLFLGIMVILILGLTNHANSTLIDYGSGLIYDDVLDITWLQNANLAATETFGVSSIGTDGSMTWNTASNWIDAMNTSNYLDYNDWRLPSMDVNNDWSILNCNSVTENECRDNELGYMYYYNLSSTSVNLENIQVAYYSSTPALPFLNPPNVWYHSFDPAYQSGIGLEASYEIFAWAVRDGNSSAPVPEPATMLLLGTGLAGLAGSRVRRKKKA